MEMFILGFLAGSIITEIVLLFFMAIHIEGGDDNEN